MYILGMSLSLALFSSLVLYFFLSLSRKLTMKRSFMYILGMSQSSPHHVSFSES
jgi:hypothetical protein